MKSSQPTTKSRVIRAKVPIGGHEDVDESSGTWNRKSTSNASLTTDRETTERMKHFSLQYGGMWQEFYDQLQAAKTKASEAELALIQVIQERDLLRFENEELTLKFKENLLSLTQQESTHLEVTAILQQIRQEKEYLLSRVTALEDHANFVEKLNRDLQGNLSHWQEKNDSIQSIIKEKDLSIAKLEQKQAYYEHECRQKDQVIQSLQEQLQQQGEEKKTMHKALDNKMKQCAALMKEKNGLKELNEQLQASISSSGHQRSLVSSTPRSTSTPRTATPSNTGNMKEKDFRIISSSNNKMKDVKKALFRSPIKSSGNSADEQAAEVISTPTAVNEIQNLISPSMTTDLFSKDKVRLQTLVDEDNKTNPWCQPLSPSTSLRTSYRKASTPTQMRRRQAATKASLLEPKSVDQFPVPE